MSINKKNPIFNPLDPRMQNFKEREKRILFSPEDGCHWVVDLQAPFEFGTS